MTTLALTKTQYLELEKIAFGAFKPLSGFMVEAEFNSVVDNMRLPDGQPFPLPVTLDVSAEQADRLRAVGAPVTLTFDGEPVGTIEIESVFTCDKQHVAEAVYGIDDGGHPGVAHFRNRGAWFVGGPVVLTRQLDFGFAQYEMRPEETRALFAERGWRTIVGFQTRNVPHRAHEYLQRVALEQVDGLFVQPLVGRKKRGDYAPEAIIAAYSAMVRGFFPADKVALGILTTSMRYAGPREAVFHAIIRRNYGCTHFIVGRDHAGVGDYYGKYDAHAMVARFEGELGIEVMRLHGPYHCSICDAIVTEQTCPHDTSAPHAVTHISGTDMRAMLSGGREPDRHLMRPEVIESIRGMSLFVEEDEL